MTTKAKLKHAEIALRTAAYRWATYPDHEDRGSYDLRYDQELNRKLLAAARTYSLARENDRGRK